MYETLENWKQYKQEKDLQTKIAKEFKLKEAIKEAKFKEFDKWMNNLIKKICSETIISWKESSN